MSDDALINMVLAFVLLLIGLMFLEGIWHGKGKLIKPVLNVDNLFFSKIRDKRILRLGDQLAFLICITMSVFTLANGLLIIAYDRIPNISAIFIFIAVVLAWPIRVIFITVYKNTEYKDIPRIWPFRK